MDLENLEKKDGTSERGYPPAALAWLVWGLGAAFYCTGFYQRVAPAVMTDQLMAEFQIGAAALGNFSAFYFYSYVAMQIPTGILADLWGPRKLLLSGSLVAAAGTVLFSMAPNLLMANLGRLLIGGSVAVAWVVLLKLSTHWFSPPRFAMVTGIALFTGVMGAVWAGVPLRIMVERFGWRPVMMISGVVTFGVCVAIWFIVRDDPSEKGYRSYAPEKTDFSPPSWGKIFRGLGEVFRHKNTWFLTLAPGGMVGPVLAFAGLWGVPFFITHYKLSPEKSAALASTLMVAWAVGGPVLGALSDRIHRRKPFYLAGNMTAALGWIVLLYVKALPPWALVFIVIIIGFASGGMIIGFAFAKESVPQNLAGTVSGVCNMGVMMGPMLLQPAMGYILDSHWQGRVIGGVRIYGIEAYHAAFGLMVAWALLSCILVALAKETGCRPMPS